MYLQEIARGYGINWTSDKIKPDVEEDKEEDSTAVEDGSEDPDANKVSLPCLHTIQLSKTAHERQSSILRATRQRRTPLPKNNQTP